MASYINIPNSGPQNVVSTSAAKGPVYYVSPTGLDTNPGTETRPWQTLAGAQTNVRSLLGVTAYGPITVLVAPGDYWQTSTLTFGPSDSGTTYPVNWMCSGAAGTAKIYGGTVLSSWELYSGSIYRARVSARVTALWENGTRARMARTPIYVNDGTHAQAGATYLLTEGVAASTTVLQYMAGNLSPASWDTNSTRIAIWSGGNNRAWFLDKRPIQSINTGSRQLTLAAATTYVMFNGTGARYYAEGDLSFLTGAGQFISRQETGQWYVYYWPTTSPITSQQIVIPAMDNVVNFQGTNAGAPVKNIGLYGFEIQYADSVYSFASNLSDYASRDKGIVRMQYAQSINVGRCNIHNGGNNGIQMLGNVQSCRITNNWVHHTDAHGIRLDNYPGIAPDEGNVSFANVIYNNKVSFCGETFGTGGIYLFNTNSNLVDHCEVSDIVRGGIEVNSGGGLGAKNYNNKNRVQFCKVLRACTDSGDMGGVYVGQTEHLANTFNQLVIDTVNAHASMTDFAPRGFMYDDQGDNQVVSNVNATNVQGSNAINNSGGTNTETNVSWGVLNASLMASDIGLIAGNPYA